MATKTATKNKNIPLNEKFAAVENSMQTRLLERDSEIHTSLLALVTGYHHFQYGEPGVAKSYLVDQLFKHIEDVNEDDMFSYMLTKFTTPEEIMGILDLNAYKTENVYRRSTTRKLPEARISFIDETFNGSSAILNTLLKILNERKFDRGDKVIDVPLISAFCASNSVPQGAELRALADRIHFWHEVKNIQDPSNRAKLLSGLDESPITDFISLGDIEAAQAEVAEVEVEDTVLNMLFDILDKVKDADVQVTDRKARQLIPAIQAEAWFNGRTSATASDLLPLTHMLWKDPSQIDEVFNAVSSYAAPMDRKAREIRSALASAMYDFNKAIGETSEMITRRKLAMEALGKLQEAQAEINKYGKMAKKEGLPTDALKELKDFCMSQQTEINRIGFGIVEEDVFSDDEEVVEEADDATSKF